MLQMISERGCNTWAFMGGTQIRRYKLDKIMIGWLHITKNNKVNIGEDLPSRTTSRLYSKG